MKRPKPRRYWVGKIIVWKRSGNPCKVVHIEDGLITLRDQSGYYCAAQAIHNRTTRDQTIRERGQEGVK